MSASIPSVAVEYDMPDAQAGGVCSTQYAWAKVPPELSGAEREALKAHIRALLKEKNIVCTPGAGFGTNGEGYVRFSAFGSRENSIAAMKRIAE